MLVAKVKRLGVALSGTVKKRDVGWSISQYTARQGFATPRNDTYIAHQVSLQPTHIMKSVLIIDDDQPILTMFSFTLENAGYRALIAQSGAEGVELAQEEEPDVILCDVNMPGMNGWDVLWAIRSDPQIAHVQFILMTGNTRDITPRAGMEVGADDFLAKPFGQDELLKSVEARLHRAEISARLAQRAESELRVSLRSTLPHEFFTPLAGILGIVELLRDKNAQVDAKELDEFLADIQKSGWRLHRTLNNYFTAIDLESSPASPEHAPSIDADRVRRAMEVGVDNAMLRHDRQDDVQVSLAPCALRGLTGDFTVLVEELVDNACAYSPRGAPIAVTCTPDGELTVRDEGRGMTQAQLSTIGAFRQFDRKKYEQQGLGLGLFLVQKIAERCGATLSVDSSPGEGTMVRVSFEKS